MTVEHIKGAKLKLPVGKDVRVGWFETADYEDGTPVAVVAATHEFGAWPNVPERPFFRPTIAEKTSEWARIAEDGFRASVLGKRTEEQVLDALGARVAGDVRRTISKIRTPALAPETVKARAARSASGKASTKPLVDTKTLITSLTWETDE